MERIGIFRRILAGVVAMVLVLGGMGFGRVSLKETKAEEASQKREYRLCGDEGLCGASAWSTDSTDNIMEDQGEVQSIKFTGIAAGDYEFKVVLNDGENEWNFEGSSAGEGGNASLHVEKDNANVNITFTTYDEKITVNVHYIEGDWRYGILEDETAKINAHIGNDTDIEIPDSIGGLKVTEIGDWAFSGCTALESVKIPESVIRIGIYAFMGCTALESVKIPESVTEIGYGAFEDCTALESVEIPKSAEVIYDYAFGYTHGSDWNYIKIPGFTIYGYANTAAKTYARRNGFEFVDMGKATEGDWVYTLLEDGTAEIIGYNGTETNLEIPKTLGGVKVTKIGSRLCDESPSITLIKSVSIPDGVTEIEGGAFAECALLESVTISESVTTIGHSAFCGDELLTKINIPNGISRIEAWTFQGCTSLKNISIPEGVTYIGNMAFDRCAIENLVIPDSVEEIIDEAFSRCKSLESLTIMGAPRLAASAFYGCESLKDIIINEGITYISAGCFMGCTALESIEIPNSVTLIQWNAFISCDSLRSIKIPNTVTDIGDRAFGYRDDYVDGEGWVYTQTPGFTIYGYANTAAEAYAKENDFIFIEIKDEIVEEPTEESTEKPTETPTEKPTETPTEVPTEKPTEAPTEESTEKPTETTTEESTEKPTEAPTEEPTETPFDAAITVDSVGEFAPELEMSKDELLSAIAGLLTEEQISAIKAGEKSIDIRLAVANIDDSVSDEDKALIDKAIENIPDSDRLDFKVMSYLDIRLGALIDGKELSVSETDGMITVSIAIEKPVNGTYKVVRIHDGKTDVIDSELSEDGTRLTFKTDKFSIYAIIYADVASGDSTYGTLIPLLAFAGLTAAAMIILTKRRSSYER